MLAFEAAMRHRTLSLRSGEVRVHLAGDAGPPLVFLHGALVSSSIWRPLGERVMAEATP